MNKLVLASHNAGKLVEMQEILADLPLQITSAAELGLGDVDETGLTFVENALLKARAACEADRKSTRLNSSHSQISYAVFCLKKKNNHREPVCTPSTVNYSLSANALPTNYWRSVVRHLPTRALVLALHLN